MPILYQRPLTALAILCVTTLALLVGTAYAAEMEVVARARSLDLGDRDTAQLAGGLRQDLTLLLQTAEYNRNITEPDAPKHSITTVPHIAAAIRAHHGVGYVVLGKREDGGSGISISNFYVLEGAPIGASSKNPSGSAERSAAETTEASHKTGFNLDLNGDEARSLVLSLHTHLGALLPPAGAATAIAVDDVIKALLEQPQVAFVVLSERSDSSTVEHSNVFVVPDVLRINITSKAGVAVSGPQAVPEVEVIPGREGEPSKIRFEFDPEKYNTNKR